VETPNKGGEHLRDNLKDIYQEIGFIEDSNTELVKSIESIGMLLF